MLLNSWRGAWCWTVQNRFAVEQFNRDVTLNRSTGVMLYRWTVMCCWTVEGRCAVEQLKREWFWTDEQTCTVEQINRVALLNSWLEKCCWTAEQRSAVEDLNRTKEMWWRTVQQSCATENCPVAHYRIRWPVIANSAFGIFTHCSVTNEMGDNYPWLTLTTNVAGQTPVLLLTDVHVLTNIRCSIDNAQWWPSNTMFRISRTHCQWKSLQPRKSRNWGAQFSYCYKNI